MCTAILKQSIETRYGPLLARRERERERERETERQTDRERQRGGECVKSTCVLVF